MYFVYDAEHEFYYYGEEKPDAGTYRRWLIDYSPSAIALDTETISLNEKTAIGIGIAVTPDISFYFPLFPTPSTSTPWHLLKRDDIIKIWHNALFDYACLQTYVLDGLISIENVHDTSAMSRLLLHRFNRLEDLQHVHKKPLGSITQLIKDHNARTMLDVPFDATAKKCMQDVQATYALQQVLIRNTNIPYFLEEMATIPIMVRMSYRGIKIDQQVRQDLEDRVSAEVDLAYEMCEEEEGEFNPGSSQQVSYILAKRNAYEVFTRLPFTDRKKNKLSSNKAVLEQMDDPLAKIILTYRNRAKFLSTYLKPWARSERAYTRFHLDAATGRPSSTDRNMQNIPGLNSPTGNNGRAMLLPDSGVFTDTDFSQLELRILAHLSGDHEMQHIFSLPSLNPDGSKNLEADIHQQTANFMGIDRKIAKNVNFAMVYGATDQTMMETAHIRDRILSARLKQMWFSKFPQAGDFIQTWQEMVRQGRTYTTTLFGRNMLITSPYDDDEDSRMRKVINYQVQGTAADMLKKFLILFKDYDLALQVHDELVIDEYVAVEKFKVAESIGPFYSPTETKYLERWE